MRLIVFLTVLLIAMRVMATDGAPVAWAGTAGYTQQDAAPCQAAITAAEQSRHVPEAFLAAIARVESGRRIGATGQVVAWPWTVNALGQGSFYETKAAAIAAVQGLQARGVQSIDVGCLQVNLMHHPDAFSSLDQAFDPGVNAAYAASFLLNLFGQTGSWPHAAAAYHSQTPTIGADYQKKVLAEWATPPSDTATVRRPAHRPQVRLASLTPGMAPDAAADANMPVPRTTAPGFGSLPHPVTGFNAPPPPAGRAMGTGRDLSAYRLMTVALASRMPR